MPNISPSDALNQLDGACAQLTMGRREHALLQNCVTTLRSALDCGEEAGRKVASMTVELERLTKKNGKNKGKDADDAGHG